MEDRKINEKESLELIAQMIRNTQNKLEQNSGRPFLLFGYCSVAFALLIWFLTGITGSYYWNYLWFLLPLICWPVAIRMYSGKRSATTYIDRVVRYIWIMTGITIIIACSFTLVFPDMECMFFAVLLLAMCTALTGLVIRIKPITITGIIGMAVSPVMLWLEGGDRLLVFALLFVLVFIIPGHILNSKSKKKA